MSLVLRHFRADDLPRMRELHGKQALDYELPELDSETMLLRTVLEENGEVQIGFFLRKVANAYLLMDPGQGTKKDKLGKILLLNRDLPLYARRAGFDEVEAFVPPTLEGRLGKLLLHLGWSKPLWPCYSRKI